MFNLTKTNQNVKNIILLAATLTLLILTGGSTWLHQSANAQEVQGSYNCAAQSTISESECEALVAIYNATNGPNWTEENGWLTGNNPCSWIGVYCTGPDVRGLDFANTMGANTPHNLSGALPAQIAQLTQLNFLNLDGNQITSLPPEIGQLTNLMNLSASSNKLTSLPPEIGQLTNLSNSLSLSNNQLTSLPPEIGQTNITQLILDSNQITSLPDEIGQLDLTWLLVSSNQLTELPTSIGNMTNLTRLNLNLNQLQSLPPEIGNLTNLTFLSIWGNALRSLPTEIGQLTKLTDTLNFSDNQLTTLPAGIGQLKVERLYVDNNHLLSLPVEIGQMENLKELYLQNNQLVSVPAEIGQLQNLTQLHLTNNQLATLPASIGQLSKLEQLYLTNNRLTSLPSEIGTLSSLSLLNVAHNQLTTIPTEINQLSRLGGLSVQHNPLSGSIPASLSSTPNLFNFFFYETDWCVPQSPTWLDSVPYVVGTGRICGQPAGAISGQVVSDNDISMRQATVSLYRQIGREIRFELIQTTNPTSKGKYSFGDLGEGINYFVYFTPPPNTGLAPQYYEGKGQIYNNKDGTFEATPITISLGQTTSNINATFGEPVSPQATISSSTASVTTDPFDGSVIVRQANVNVSDITVTRIAFCDDNSTPERVSMNLNPSTFTVGAAYRMTATGNPNEYRATIPASEVLPFGILSVSVVCDGTRKTSDFGRVTLFEPGGVVKDSSGEPLVADATVQFFSVPFWQAKTGPDDVRPNSCQSGRSKEMEEVWNQSAPTDLGILADIEYTVDNEGYYGFEVPEGCWYVVVSADGYLPLISPIVGVPPEITDLNFRLMPLSETSSLYLPTVHR